MSLLLLLLLFVRSCVRGEVIRRRSRDNFLAKHGICVGPGAPPVLLAVPLCCCLLSFFSVAGRLIVLVTTVQRIIIKTTAATIIVADANDDP